MDVGRVRRGLGLVVAGVLLAGSPAALSGQVAVAAVPAPAVAAVPAARLAITSAKPKISGTLAVGSTLKVVPGKWSPKTKFAYRWLAAGKSIKKATKSTFKLTKAQAGKQISVRVTGKLGASKVSKTSSVSVKVLLVGAPKVTGKVAVGSTVSVSRGTWTSGVKFSYVWLRDGLAVPGAKGSSYKVAASDAGHRLSVKVTGKRSGYATVSKSSGAVLVPGAVPPPPVPGLPTIAGNTFVGSMLVADPGDWADGTVFSYQWLRNGVAIPGATAVSYTLVSADSKQQISVVVTGVLGSVSLSATSVAVSVAAEVPPSITGTATVGSVLMAAPGVWAPGWSLSYQWLRNGVAIAGATGTTYALVVADGKQLVSVKVTGKFGVATVSKTSAEVMVSNQTLQTATPKIDGSAIISQTLTANPGTWTAGTTFTYQWFIGETPITPEAGFDVATRGTERTLRLGYREAGHKVTVAITGSKAGYDTVTKTSEAATIPSDGDFKIGVDIPAGTLTAPGSDYCIWWRFKPQQDGPPFGTQIGYRWYNTGPTVVTLNSDVTWFESTGCGAWAPVDQAATPKTSFGDGDFLIGTQVKAGYYEATNYTNDCKLYLAPGATGLISERADPYRPTAGVTVGTVVANAYRVTSAGCGTWTWKRDAP